MPPDDLSSSCFPKSVILNAVSEHRKSLQMETVVMPVLRRGIWLLASASFTWPPGAKARWFPACHSLRSCLWRRLPPRTADLIYYRAGMTDRLMARQRNDLPSDPVGRSLHESLALFADKQPPLLAHKIFDGLVRWIQRQPLRLIQFKLSAFLESD